MILLIHVIYFDYCWFKGNSNKILHSHQLKICHAVVIIGLILN